MFTCTPAIIGSINSVVVMHISTACAGGNEGEFGVLSVYSAREPQGNYKLRNNRTTGGGEVGDFDMTI